MRGATARIVSITTLSGGRRAPASGERIHTRYPVRSSSGEGSTTWLPAQATAAYRRNNSAEIGGRTRRAGGAGEEGPVPRAGVLDDRAGDADLDESPQHLLAEFGGHGDGAVVDADVQENAMRTGIHRYRQLEFAAVALAAKFRRRIEKCGHTAPPTVSGPNCPTVFSGFLEEWTSCGGLRGP